MPMTPAMPRLGWLSRFLIDAAGPGSWPGGKGDRAACHRAQCPGYRELGYGQWRYGARHLRKEDSCPSLLHLVRIQVLPLRRAHPPTAPSRRCHTRPPAPTRTDPLRPADGARLWHHCASCCAELRQAPPNPEVTASSAGDSGLDVGFCRAGPAVFWLLRRSHIRRASIPPSTTTGAPVTKE